METKEKKMLVQRTKRMAGLFVAVLTMLCSLQMTVFAESGKAEVAGKVYEFEKDTPKAINRKKLVAFVLPIIRKEKLPMSEELEKLRHKQYVAERKLTAAKHKEKRLQSELLILDEPTAAIDPLHEGELYHAFQESCSGKIGVIITHRLGIVKLCSAVLVLKGGKQVDFGTHGELLERCPYYRSLWKSQANLYT